MKKLFLPMLAVLALITTSCSSNDDNPSENKKGVTIDHNNFNETLKKGDNVTLDASKIYKLTGPFVVGEGATLTIPEGTVIEATGGTSAYIAVAQGGKIYVKGTASKPVIMTSGKSSPAAGDWGGLVICGKASTNKGKTANAEVSRLTYGGTENDDDSGSIKYLRIEYTGAAFSGKKEFNGLSLFGVGSKTVVEYVQSFKGGDDGIEFFGGTVNGKYLVSIGSGDDSIDFADGWSGTGENWYIRGGTKAGIEGSNNEDNSAIKPTTTATLKNITIVGPGTEGGVYIKDGGGNWTVDNLYISGYETGIKVLDPVTDPVANSQIANEEIKFTNVTFVGVGSKTDYKGEANFFREGTATGAGAGAELPDWAKGWAREK